MTEELKPCPFCGKAPICSPSGIKNNGLMIECAEYNCVKPHVSIIPPEEAIAAWNRRTADLRAGMEKAAEIADGVAGLDELTRRRLEEKYRMARNVLLQ